MTEPLFLPPWFHVQGLELELIALFSPYTCALLSFLFHTCLCTVYRPVFIHRLLCVAYIRVSADQINVRQQLTRWVSYMRYN